jgi:pimeloyl-ACP methyl ester carboxylesterase
VTVRTVELAVDDAPHVLSIAEAGEGGRPLLLVHGFTGAKEDFTDWLDRLAGHGWHVVAPDQRGHGESVKPADEAAYSFELYARDLLALLDALGWRSVVALGHSMGGMVVQTAVLAAPDRFDGLVLMDTSHRALRANPDIIDIAVAIARTEGMAAVMAAAEAAEADNPLTNEIADRMNATVPGYKEFGERKMLASSPAMYAAMLRSITDDTGGVDRLPQLASVAVPTLVIVGEADAPFRKPSAAMADAIPGAELVVIPDAAHSPQFENPELWWQALAGFLDRLQAADSASP